MNDLISIAKLDKALRRLAGLLAAEGLEMELALCYGRVFVTLYHAPGVSDHGHAILAEPGRAWDFVREVADKKGLPQEWLKEEGKLFLAFFGARNRTDYDLFSPGIILSLHEPRHVLTMKIREVLEQGSADACEDIRFLTQRMGLHTPATVSDVYRSFFPGEALPGRVAALMSAQGEQEESP